MLVSGDGTITSISFFQDKAGADQSTQTASGWVRERLSTLLPNPPEVTAGEITVHAETGRGSGQTTSTRQQTSR